MSPVADLSLTDLARQADVTPRTVRYYIGQGLLPGPIGQGPAAHYDGLHLDRLRLIKRLQLQHLPLADIRARLESLGDDEISMLATEVEPDRGSESTGAPGQSALAYIRTVLAGSPLAGGTTPALTASTTHASTAARAREPTADYGAPPWLQPPPPKPRPPGSDRSTWERISLAPDIELHVRRPLAPQSIKQLDQLLDAARKLLRDE
jgi:DNA-binding transcriptional MerR regulator